MFGLVAERTRRITVQDGSTGQSERVEFGAPFFPSGPLGMSATPTAGS